MRRVEALAEILGKPKVSIVSGKLEYIINMYKGVNTYEVLKGFEVDGRLVPFKVMKGYINSEEAFRSKVSIPSGVMVRYWAEAFPFEVMVFADISGDAKAVVETVVCDYRGVRDRSVRKVSLKELGWKVRKVEGVVVSKEDYALALLRTAFEMIILETGADADEVMRRFCRC